jgi:hypothetical protein
VGVGGRVGLENKAGGVEVGVVLRALSPKRVVVGDLNSGKPAEDGCEVLGCNWTDGSTAFLFSDSNKEPGNGELNTPPAAP